MVSTGLSLHGTENTLYNIAAVTYDRLHPHWDDKTTQIFKAERTPPKSTRKCKLNLGFSSESRAAPIVVRFFIGKMLKVQINTVRWDLNSEVTLSTRVSFLFIAIQFASIIILVMYVNRALCYLPTLTTNVKYFFFTYLYSLYIPIYSLWLAMTRNGSTVGQGVIAGHWTSIVCRGPRYILPCSM